MGMLGILIDDVAENKIYDIGWGAKVLYFRFAKKNTYNISTGSTTFPTLATRN